MKDPIFKKNKEYIAFCHYDVFYSDEDGSTQTIISEELDFMSKCLKGEHWRLVDLKQIKDNFDSHIKYLLLYDKYMSLQVESDNMLTYNKEGFQLYGKTFQSLDEVKRAIKLKAFS